MCSLKMATLLMISWNLLGCWKTANGDHSCFGNSDFMGMHKHCLDPAYGDYLEGFVHALIHIWLGSLRRVLQEKYTTDAGKIVEVTFEAVNPCWQLNFCRSRHSRSFQFHSRSLIPWRISLSMLLSFFLEFHVGIEAFVMPAGTLSIAATSAYCIQYDE
jgi:hypothetical protein